MASYDYLILANSNASLSKKFRTLQAAYQRRELKEGKTHHVPSGGLERTVGGIYTYFQHVVKVKHTETETGFGSLADLRTFFNLNNPAGTPSDVITLTDHLGATHSVYLSGSLDESTLTAEVEGNNAIYFVKCMFEVIPA